MISVWTDGACSGNDKVFCRLCGASLKVITNSHLKQHGVSPAEYQSRFPDAPMRSATSSKKHADSSTTANKSYSKRNKQKQRMSGELNPFFGKNHSEDSRALMSASVKKAWGGHYERLSVIRKETARTGDNHHLWKGGRDVAYLEGRRGSAKWGSRRRAISAFGNTCMVPRCGFDFIVHNHHIEPVSVGGSLDLDNCILLCPNHHALADAGELEPQYLHTLVEAHMRSIYDGSS